MFPLYPLRKTETRLSLYFKNSLVFIIIIKRYNISPIIIKAHLCYVFQTSTFLILPVWSMHKFEIPKATCEPFEIATRKGLKFRLAM